jgi:sec-independent protein translocase protein TatB
MELDISTRPGHGLNAVSSIAEMPSFSDSIFLFILALLLFGPKKLPVLARELGKWVGEFRRASNEFKMQMEDELRVSEQADRQKKIAAMEAAAPVAPTLTAEAEGGLAGAGAETSAEPYSEPPHPHMDPPADGVMTPLPIATSGELNMMPPATGLPTPRTDSFNSAGSNEHAADTDALGGLIGSIPEAHGTGEAPQLSEIEHYARENALHGD